MAFEEVNPVVLYGRMDTVTRVQYGLMMVFGALTVGIAFGPVSGEVQRLAVAVTFGITSGLWISHLIGVLHTELSGGQQ